VRNQSLVKDSLFDLLTGAVATGVVVLAAVATPAFTDMRQVFLIMALLFVVAGFTRGSSLPTFEEHAQDGRGIKRSAQRTGVFLSPLAERSRALCAHSLLKTLLLISPSLLMLGLASGTPHQWCSA
jgi:hypothetical protein